MKLALLISVAIFAVSRAGAHPVAQGALEITNSGAKLEMRVRVAPEEVFVANMHAQFPASSTADAYSQHGDYLLRHLRVFADERELIGARLRFSAPEPGAAHASYDFEFPLSGGARSIRLEQNVLNEFNYAPGNRWEATYMVRYRNGAETVLDGALLTSTSPLLISADFHTRVWCTARDYLRHGITHILTGYDHLLFIAALALAVTSLWELFKIVAAFTLAHTITLTLSVLDIVRLPSHFVEPMIAASIVFVALQNVFWPGQTRGAGRLGVAFFFGLFHGLGFAGGLLDAMSGMPGVAVSLAIFSFSLGVEIGHQFVVLPLFGLTSAARKFNFSKGGAAAANRAGEQLLRGGSALIGAAGAFYLVAAVAQLTLLWRR